jgi:hypothetical protein
MKIKEQNEQITVFRNETGSPVGIIITEDESPEPLYGAFIYCVVNGWKWLSESTDKEKVYHQAREYFFCHHHFCPMCHFDVECEHSYKCSDMDKDELCEDCTDLWKKKDRTNIEIAENFTLWGEYVDPERRMTESKFFSMTLQQRVEKIEAIEKLFDDSQSEPTMPDLPADAHLESQFEERTERYD